MVLPRLPSWLDRFVLALLTTVAVASLVPARGVATHVFDHLTTAAICLLFFLHGARLSPQAAWHGVRQWRLHLLVFSLTFVMFPLLALALRALEPAVLTHDLFVGVVFLAVLPSTVQSSIAFTSIARGNVAAAICSATLSNLIGVLLSPLLVALLLGSAAHMSADALLSIAAQLLLPFLLGQLSRPFLGRWVERHRRTVVLVDRGSVLLVVYTAFSAGVVAGIWHQVSAPRLTGLVIVDCVLLAAVLTVSGQLARRIRLSREDRIVAIFCGSKKSLASGLPMATVLFPAHSVSTIVLPLMLFHQIQLLVCAVLARRYARDPLQVGGDGERVGLAPRGRDDLDGQRQAFV